MTYKSLLKKCETGFQPVARPVENRSHMGLQSVFQRADKCHPPVSHRRPAGGYVYFLSTSLLVLTIGMAALLASRVERQTAVWSADAVAARAHAVSAIEIGQAIIAQESDWRNKRGSGVWFTGLAVGAGTCSLTVTIQTDGDANPNNNPAMLEGTGYQGDAIQRVRVRLIPASTNGGLVPERGSWERI